MRYLVYFEKLKAKAAKGAILLTRGLYTLRAPPAPAPSDKKAKKQKHPNRFELHVNADVAGPWVQHVQLNT